MSPCECALKPHHRSDSIGHSGDLPLDECWMLTRPVSLPRCGHRREGRRVKMVFTVKVIKGVWTIRRCFALLESRVLRIMPCTYRQIICLHLSPLSPLILRNVLDKNSVVSVHRHRESCESCLSKRPFCRRFCDFKPRIPRLAHFLRS